MSVFITEENRQSFKWFLQSFVDSLDWNREQDKSVTSHIVIDKYLDNQVAMQGGMQQFANYEKEICSKNKRLLNAIKSVKGKTFHKHLLGIIKESEGLNGLAEIVPIPQGGYQRENWGRDIKGYWIEQWSVGMEGDSYEGNVYVQIKPNKYLKLPYSM